MSNATNFSEFYQENKKLVREYIETRVELLKLKGVRSLAGSQFDDHSIHHQCLLLFVMLFLGMSFARWIASSPTAMRLIPERGRTIYTAGYHRDCSPEALFRTPVIKMFISEAMKDELEGEEE
jgi:hypothetical protein